MNPYAPLFSHPVDITMAWLSATAWLVIVAAKSRARVAALPIRSEQVCSRLASAFLSLAVAIMSIFTVGLVFLAWLKISSAFWFIWELFYLMSVVIVFRVMPLLAVILICWAAVGRWRAGFSLRSLRLTSTCLVAVLLDELLASFLQPRR